MRTSKDYRIIEVNKKCFRIQQKHTSPWRNPAEWWEYCYESTGETEEVLDKPGGLFTDPTYRTINKRRLVEFKTKKEACKWIEENSVIIHEYCTCGKNK